MMIDVDYDRPQQKPGPGPREAFPGPTEGGLRSGGQMSSVLATAEDSIVQGSVEAVDMARCDGIRRTGRLCIGDEAVQSPGSGSIGC